MLQKNTFLTKLEIDTFSKDFNMKYKKPKIEVHDLEIELLTLSEDGPPAVINPPGIEGGHTSLSIWDNEEDY